VGLVTLVWAIIEAPGRGWTEGSTLAAFLLAAVLLGAFVAWERRSDHPMLDVNFFANPRFTAASTAVTMVFFALFGSMFLQTQYLQFVLGYTPFDAGLRTLPFAAAMIVVAPFSSKLVERLGTKWVVVGGMLIFATGLVVASTITIATGYPRLGVAMLLLGAGLGLSSAPATESIMGALPRSRAGVGSAVNDTAREIGGALGVAIVGSIVSSIYRSHLADRLPARVPASASEAAHDSSVQHSRSALALGHSARRLRTPLAGRSSTRCLERPSSRRASPALVRSSRGVTSRHAPPTTPRSPPTTMAPQHLRSPGTSADAPTATPSNAAATRQLPECNKCVAPHYRSTRRITIATGLDVSPLVGPPPNASN